MIPGGGLTCFPQANQGMTDHSYKNMKSNTWQSNPPGPESLTTLKLLAQPISQTDGALYAGKFGLLRNFVPIVQPEQLKRVLLP